MRLDVIPFCLREHHGKEKNGKQVHKKKLRVIPLERSHALIKATIKESYFFIQQTSSTYICFGDDCTKINITEAILICMRSSH